MKGKEVCDTFKTQFDAIIGMCLLKLCFVSIIFIKIVQFILKAFTSAEKFQFYCS